MRIAIAGATGYIGGRLVPSLLDTGHEVRCLVRSPRKLEGREWVANPRAQIREVDLSKPESVAQGLEGCEAVYYLVHSMISAEENFASRDLELAKTFAGAAREAKVGRIIYLGGLGKDGSDLSEHLASRREVEAALACSGVPVTVLRAAIIIGSGSASFEILRYLTHRLPVMIVPKWVSTPCQPIAIENVLSYLTKVLDVPETTGQTFDIGGSEVLRYRDLMVIMAQELGLGRRFIIPVPVLTPRLSSYWIHLVTPLSSKLARPLAEGLRNEVICHDTRITSLIPQKLLNAREAIRAALIQLQEHLVETHWSMAGPIPGDPDWSGGTVFRDERNVVIDAPPDTVWKAVCQLGGANGWYAQILWRFRGWLDSMVGGPGLRRGRRSPDSLRYGDALDFWRVVGIEKDHCLSLRAEMRVPGVAVLDFHIESPASNRCILRQTALFQPRGLAGLLYWYSVLPFHNLIFKGMLNRIKSNAVKRAAQDAAPKTRPASKLRKSPA